MENFNAFLILSSSIIFLVPFDFIFSATVQIPLSLSLFSFINFLPGILPAPADF